MSKHVIDVHFQMNTGSKNNGAPRRLANTLAVIGDLMDVMLLVLAAVVLIADEYRLFPLSAATEKGVSFGVFACAAALVGSSIDVVDAKMTYRWWGTALPATWAAIAVLFAGAHIFGVLLPVSCSQECYISSALVILWGSAAFFLKSLFIPEAEKTKR